MEESVSVSGGSTAVVETEDQSIDPGEKENVTDTSCSGTALVKDGRKPLDGFKSVSLFDVLHLSPDSHADIIDQAYRLVSDPKEDFDFG